jgi:predicted dehydrogenase
MRALVVGGGSIGKRHLQNLRRLGIENLSVVEVDRDRRQMLETELGLTGFDDLQAGLSFLPDFVVIASPTHLHMEQSQLVASADLDLFVEKPLCHDPRGMCELADVVERKNLVSLVGCNMRFHPGPAKVKELLAEGRVGRVLFARLHCGSYLPGWRPGADYRENYAAHCETGGGCILDCIHEIDLCRWYLGEITGVFCMAGQLSSLEISAEDVAALVCRHASGAISEIHLDYVQRTYERGCQIVGESGSIFWDFGKSKVRCYDAAADRWESFTSPEDWQTGEMYVAEMEHFLDCVRSRSQTTLTIPAAIDVMDVVFAAKASARDGNLVATRKEVLA